MAEENDSWLQTTLGIDVSTILGGATADSSSAATTALSPTEVGKGVIDVLPTVAGDLLNLAVDEAKTAGSAVLFAGATVVSKAVSLVDEDAAKSVEKTAKSFEDDMKRHADASVKDAEKMLEDLQPKPRTIELDEVRSQLPEEPITPFADVDSVERTEDLPPETEDPEKLSQSAQAGDIENALKKAGLFDKSNEVAGLVNKAGVPENVKANITILVSKGFNVSIRVATTPSHPSGAKLAGLLNGKFAAPMKAALQKSGLTITDPVEVKWLTF